MYIMLHICILLIFNIMYVLYSYLLDIFKYICIRYIFFVRYLLCFFPVYGLLIHFLNSLLISRNLYLKHIDKSNFSHVYGY